MTVSYATYCVLDSDRELPEGISGLQAGTVCNLPYRGIGVAVSPLAKPIEDIVAGAVEHEAVVERLMQTHTVLPMRFPTVFDHREAVLTMMSQHYDPFRENLRRLYNQVEFGVRVLWPRGEGPGSQTCGPLGGDPLNSTAEGGCAIGGHRDARATIGGRQYLQECYDRYRNRQALGRQTARFERRLDAVLGEFATAKRLRSAATGAFIFDGVYLVDQARSADFRHAFARAKRSEPEFEYLFSGPWPPYNFVTR